MKVSKLSLNVTSAMVELPLQGFKKYKAITVLVELGTYTHGLENVGFHVALKLRYI